MSIAKKNVKPANAATEDITTPSCWACHNEAWCLDYGASYHSYTNAGVTDSYTTRDIGKVQLADDEPMKIVGKGDVRIINLNGYTLQLDDIRHIGGHKRNLSSIGVIDDEGYYVTFGDGEWKVTKWAMVVARVKKTGILYIILNKKDNNPLTEANSDADLWHYRLGHMNEKGTKELYLRGKLSGQ